ncbi:uncharacterized protein [Dermacentor andersoni]|uniref:uncharacterized protein isoform X3 n=1 Tax=Dermacentor andersoni TaxID=34620 RepID=UPI0024178F65|nr:uncharacterized protein LOC126539909 isoform X3 [Dermacentor andersoni]
MNRAMAESPSSRIPVLQRADGSWTTVEHKLRQLDDMAEPGPYVRLLAGCCRDSVQAARAMQAQLDAARAEVNALRLQLRKSVDRIAQMEEDRQNLCSAAQRAEAEAGKVADAVRYVTEEQSRLRAQLERLSVELVESLRQRHEQLESRVRESLDSLAEKQGESQRHGQPRLYSRPFGIEREGSVRCVLRLVACLGVPAGQEPGDAVQLGLELLHSAKCNKKFDFCLRLLDRSGSDRHLVKTFSSSELAVPRYWFSRPALGVVSFAVLISEQRMLREGLLSRDALAIEVGLQ